MGILNVTPDSFSDGGRFVSVESAVEHGQRLHAEGADIIDVGGESTRPQGAVPIDEREELRRVIPVIERLARELPGVTLSVDTVKGGVARAALEAGARVVNDVSGLRLDPGLGEICAEAGAGVILMHSRGPVSEMGTYAHASYSNDVVGTVLGELRERVSAARAVGVAEECVAVDPGIGFSKRSEHSLETLAELVAWGYPVVVGVSRKRFIGELTGVAIPAERVFGSVGANVSALERGARIFRVHDVAANRQALDVAWAIARQRTSAAGAVGVGSHGAP
jgi:dihydropteroate synthase